MRARADIHAVILAGGEGRRMGGADKGLALFCGQTLAQRAAQRVAPTVGRVTLSVNRNAQTYAALGLDVLGDGLEAFEGVYQGPLYGVLVALRACTAPYLAVLPCDVPFFPVDIVPRLSKTLAQSKHAQVAMPLAAQPNGAPFIQPVFMCIATRALPGLEAYFLSGGRKMTAWAGQAGLAIAPYTDAGDVLAFTDADTEASLRELELQALTDSVPTPASKLG